MRLLRTALAAFGRPTPEIAAAERVHQMLSAAARRPEFYLAGEVPDTIDGRFDLLALHAVLAFRRLTALGPEGTRLAQRTCDLMFAAFDDAVRSLGVGDMGVPHKVRAMATAYGGRAEAYNAALDTGDRAALEAALARNLYRGKDSAAVPAIASYVETAGEALAQCSLADFEAGKALFPSFAPGEERRP
ncbi:MAG: ubiquinol-cytochrome C chaperone [Alphaproteobacteria bacterium]|nr:ubiquinol-cytochrome C chaperone [Alphaproteobacteria bacterium]